MTTTQPPEATPTPAPTPAPTSRGRTLARVGAATTYGRLDLRRQLRDATGMFFIVALPAFLFLVFGMGDDEAYGSANVAMYVMVSMAAYGAVSATTAVAAVAATEQRQGWGRQLALTPLSPVAFVLVKAAVAMLVAAVPIALIYGIGAATGAQGTAGDWIVTALVTWAGSIVFAAYGLAICLVFRGPNASGVASGLIVVLGFLGNVFMPMDGFILDLGRFTPLYGYAGLARYPITEGWLPRDAGQDELWLLIANVGAWTVIFVALAAWGLRRGRERV